MAFFGVLKPSPTSLYQREPPLPFLFDLPLCALWLRKMCGCFWNARSLCTANSVAMIAVLSNQWVWRMRESVLAWASSVVQKFERS